jgi:hypothetical protein
MSSTFGNNVSLGRRDHTDEETASFMGIRDATDAAKKTCDEATVLLQKANALVDRFESFFNLKATCEAAPADPRFLAMLSESEVKCAASEDAETRRHARRLHRINERCRDNPRYAARCQKHAIESWEDDTGEVAATDDQGWWERFKAWFEEHETLFKIIQMFLSLLFMFIL